ncbi:hypothetical protein JW877_07425 [bacterium]|nr:hypothetical protein [bacterium]
MFNNKLSIIIILYMMLYFPTCLIAWEFSGDLSLALEYDDNICNLAPLDKESVGLNNDKLKLETADDFVYTPHIFVKVKERLWGVTTSLGITLNYNLYSQNPYKNYLYIRPRLKLTKFYTTLTLAYTFIPEYTLRTFYDDDQPYGQDHYPWCSYTLNRFTGQINGPLWKKLDGSFRFDYELMFYNENFLEYDSRSYEIEPALGLNTPLKLWLGYSYRLSDAQGIDEQGEQPLTSDDSDISYSETQYYVSAEYNKIRLFGKTFGVGFKFTYASREYTTEKTGLHDPYHSTREETKSSFNNFINLALNYNLSLELAYDYTFRKAESLVYPEISEIKDYQRNGIKITVLYDLDTF